MQSMITVLEFAAERHGHPAAQWGMSQIGGGRLRLVEDGAGALFDVLRST
jgi:hypothetical protein